MTGEKKEDEEVDSERLNLERSTGALQMFFWRYQTNVRAAG